MKRHRQFDPADYGIAMSKAEFKGLLFAMFREHAGDDFTLDELLLNPREAIGFCDLVRRRVPSRLRDFDILRLLMQVRKRGKRQPRKGVTSCQEG